MNPPTKSTKRYCKCCDKIVSLYTMTKTVSLSTEWNQESQRLGLNMKKMCIDASKAYKFAFPAPIRCPCANKGIRLHQQLHIQPVTFFQRKHHEHNVHNYTYRLYIEYMPCIQNVICIYLYSFTVYYTVFMCINKIKDIKAYYHQNISKLQNIRQSRQKPGSLPATKSLHSHSIRQRWCGIVMYCTILDSPSFSNMSVAQGFHDNLLGSKLLCQLHERRPSIQKPKSNLCCSGSGEMTCGHVTEKFPDSKTQ